MATCQQCGKANDADARFCSSCGARLPTDATPAAARRTVTVVFCDVTGSTAMGERLDPEATRRVMTRYFATAREVLEQHGGTVEKFIGDAVMAVFGIPRVHEDDALRAVRAAEQLRASTEDLELRIGVNTGEVVTGAGESLVTGDAVNVAARLEQSAKPGEILIGASTHALVREAVDAEVAGDFVLRGKSEPVQAYRLLRTNELADPFARRFDAPLVGRRSELAELEDAHGRVLSDRSCRVFTLIGPPGIGKSRLAREFLGGVADVATVVTGRCLAYGDGITYWPLVEIVRDLGGAAEIVGRLRDEPNARQLVDDVVSGIGIEEGGNRPEETSRAVRRLFEALGRQRPLTVLLDDLQWAEPTFLDLVEHIGVLSRDSPIMLLCLARPELFDERPRWNEGLPNAATLRLEPLTDDEAGTLMTNLLEGDHLGHDVRDRIAAAAAGNPLFVEQMLAMLSEAPDGDVAVPPTIQALLAARLDRLEPSERSVLECASVVGKEFWHRIVGDLGAEPAVLPALVRKELIRPHRSTVFPADDAYEFRHDLIRDAAYAEIPKERRAELHEGCADWLEQHLPENDEIVGYHLEQAYGLRSEVGIVDRHTSALAERAGRLLGAAGLRAADRADIPATVNLLTRAASLLEPGDRQRLELLVHLGYAHMDAGENGEARAVFADAHERAVEAEHAIVASRATVGELALRWDEGLPTAEVFSGIEREIGILEELNDSIGLGEAYREAGKAESGFGRTERADRFFEQAVVNARSSGSRRVESDVLVWRLAMQCWGYMPAGEGARTASALLEEGAGGLGGAFALVVRGRYRALQGDLAGGREDMAAGRALIRGFGADNYIAGSGQESAMLELEADDPVAAEIPAREAHEMFMDMRPNSAGSAYFLGRALVEQGRLAEGEELVRLLEERSPPDDPLAQADWRYLKASVLSGRGEVEQALALAHEAVALEEQTDFLEFHAKALLVLADVLTLRGDLGKARDALAQAVRLYERKESVFGIARTRARLARLSGEPLAELL